MPDTWSETPVGNARMEVAAIDPKRMQNRRVRPARQRAHGEDTPQWRDYIVEITDVRRGRYWNPPFDMEYRATMVVRVAYPVRLQDEHEIDTIIREDIESIVSRLNYAHMDSDSTGLLNRWFTGASILSDDDSGVIYSEIEFEITYE